MTTIFKIDELKRGNLKVEPRRETALQLLMENFKFYDLDAPYQRGAVWKKEYKVDLFESIFNSIPIGTIHLVKKFDDNPYDYWVLDGKQRLSAIYSFMSNDFPIFIKSEHGGVSKICWDNILQENHPCHFLKTKLFTYPVQVVYWEPMDFNEQKRIFLMVNNSMGLTGWEKMYGEYYLVKKFMNYIFDNQFQPVRKYLNNSVDINHRYTGIKLCHSLLVYAFGYHFNEKFQERALSKVDISESCKFLETLLVENGITCSLREERYDDLLLDKIGLYKQLKMFKNACKWFDLCIRKINKLGSKNKFDGNTILDTVAFFIGKMQQNILTNSIVEQNIDTLSEFVKEWVILKKTKELKQRSTSESSIKDRISVMEDLFLKCNIDFGIKNKRITDVEKTIAAMNSTDVDPVSGIFIDEDNAQFEHVDPKSVFSNTKVQVVSDITNKRKGDQTMETMKKTLRYIEQNHNQ